MKQESSVGFPMSSSEDDPAETASSGEGSDSSVGSNAALNPRNVGKPREVSDRRTRSMGLLDGDSAAIPSGVEVQPPPPASPQPSACAPPQAASDQSPEVTRGRLEPTPPRTPIGRHSGRPISGNTPRTTAGEGPACRPSPHAPSPVGPPGMGASYADVARQNRAPIQMCEVGGGPVRPGGHSTAPRATIRSMAEVDTAIVGILPPPAVERSTLERASRELQSFSNLLGVFSPLANRTLHVLHGGPGEFVPCIPPSDIQDSLLRLSTRAEQLTQDLFQVTQVLQHSLIGSVAAEPVVAVRSNPAPHPPPRDGGISGGHSLDAQRAGRFQGRARKGASDGRHQRPRAVEDGRASPGSHHPAPPLQRAPPVAPALEGDSAPLTVHVTSPMRVKEFYSLLRESGFHRRTHFSHVTTLGSRAFVIVQVPAALSARMAEAIRQTHGFNVTTRDNPSDRLESAKWAGMTFVQRKNRGSLYVCKEIYEVTLRELQRKLDRDVHHPFYKSMLERQRDAHRSFLTTEIRNCRTLLQAEKGEQNLIRLHIPRGSRVLRRSSGRDRSLPPEAPGDGGNPGARPPDSRDAGKAPGPLVAASPPRHGCQTGPRSDRTGPPMGGRRQ